MATRVSALALVIAGWMAFTSPAQAHLVRWAPHSARLSPQVRLEMARQNLNHARYVAQHGRGRIAAEHRRALHWLRGTVARWDAVVHPPLRSLVDPCTAAIIDVENPSWDPGRWNSQGSGAFGLPQALPYSKMPKPAWPRKYGGREDPIVQMHWMVQYERERYGSPCLALAYWNSHSSY